VLRGDATIRSRDAKRRDLVDDAVVREVRSAAVESAKTTRESREREEEEVVVAVVTRVVVKFEM
jgi:hypothetical protein